MKSDRLYIKKHTGFFIKQGEELVATTLSQPTPEGVMVLCEHYSQKYGIDLRCIDLHRHVEFGDNIAHFFAYLQRTPSILDIEENQTVGLILSHGQHHVIPLLITKKEGVKHMVVFDSTSGARIKGYFGIANLFTDCKFYLNTGTRQADEGSCMTDAICILKEALMIREILSLIQSKQISEHPAFIEGRFFKASKPAHFFLFKMPERLLLTAQISSYLVQAQADLGVILRGGKSLQSYRDDFLLPVVLVNDTSRALTPINGYLYLKAEEHKDILDAKLCHSESIGSLDELEIDFNPVLSCSDSREDLVENSPYPKARGFSAMG